MVRAGGSDPSSAGRPAFLALRFGVEIWTLVVLVVAGASASAGLTVRIVLAVLGPVVVTVFWGLAMAPRARRRLRDPVRLVAELVIFILSAALLALSGHVLAAAIYGIVAASVAVLTRVIAPEA